MWPKRNATKRRNTSEQIPQAVQADEKLEGACEALRRGRRGFLSYFNPEPHPEVQSPSDCLEGCDENLICAAHPSRPGLYPNGLRPGASG